MVSPEKDLMSAVEHAVAALMHVPKVGEQFDQQHSDIQMSAYLALQRALMRVKIGDGDNRFVEQLKSMPLPDALWWFIENVSDDVRARAYFHLRERIRRYWRDPDPERAKEQEFRTAQSQGVRKDDALSSKGNGSCRRR